MKEAAQKKNIYIYLKWITFPQTCECYLRKFLDMQGIDFV